MKFKEMYLSGLCGFDHIEHCIKQWQDRYEGEMAPADYLGLTHEEYEMFLQYDVTTTLQECLDSQRRCQHYRIYQIDLSSGNPVPFAFAGIRKLREAGYEQPPASLYRLVCDGSIFCPKEQSEHDVLERIFTLYSDSLPSGFPGRNTALSDVIELYGDDRRSYFYCDTAGFPGVKFSPMLTKRGG